MAFLVEPRYADMFWDSYRVVPLPGAELSESMYTERLWHSGELAFRNRGTGELVAAFAGGQVPTRNTPRVLMRGLYVHRRITIFDGLIARFSAR